jgi:hypothetical protein
MLRQERFSRKSMSNSGSRNSPAAMSPRHDSEEAHPSAQQCSPSGTRSPRVLVTPLGHTWSKTSMLQRTPSHCGSSEATAEGDASPTVAPCGCRAVTISSVMPFTNLGSTSILLHVWKDTIWQFLEAGGRQMDEWPLARAGKENE